MSNLTVSTVQVGAIYGIPVNVAMAALNPQAQINKVMLSVNYTMYAPPGFPARPPCGGPYPGEPPITYNAGGLIYVFDFEAAAIVAAGGGAIVGVGYP